MFRHNFLQSLKIKNSKKGFHNHLIKNFDSFDSLKVVQCVFLTGYDVAAVTYYVEKTTITCSPFMPFLLFQLIKSGSIDKSNYKCWKMMETCDSHLKAFQNHS